MGTAAQLRAYATNESNNEKSATLVAGAYLEATMQSEVSTYRKASIVKSLLQLGVMVAHARIMYARI